jgi:hypothetical protein
MVNMNIMTEEMKKELAFTEEELKELEQFLPIPQTILPTFKIPQF